MVTNNIRHDNNQILIFPNRFKRLSGRIEQIQKGAGDLVKKYPDIDAGKGSIGCCYFYWTKSTNL